MPRGRRWPPAAAASADGAAMPGAGEAAGGGRALRPPAHAAGRHRTRPPGRARTASSIPRRCASIRPRVAASLASRSLETCTSGADALTRRPCSASACRAVRRPAACGHRPPPGPCRWPARCRLAALAAARAARQALAVGAEVRTLRPHDLARFGGRPALPSRHSGTIEHGAGAQPVHVVVHEGMGIATVQRRPASGPATRPARWRARRCRVSVSPGFTL